MIALCLVISAPVYAEEPAILPAGSRVQAPGGETFTLSATRFLVSREALDNAIASADLAEVLSDELVKCSEANQELVGGDSSGWLTAAKWGSLGLAVGVVFGAGVLLGGTL